MSVRIDSATAKRLGITTTKSKAPKVAKITTDTAQLFASAWATHPQRIAAVSWVAEYVFAKPRRYRFDWALPDRFIAVEVDGGQWVAGGGRHNRDSDRDKINLAVSLGWRVLRFSTQQLERNPHGCVDLVLTTMTLNQ
jgi:hypothetical protein